ncbi:MAG: ATP-binding cassette domain-containing protein [Bacteroidales bacterium]|nr:ATP-binding cassette domain-containing protein [Bacteroidales bacterium]
MLDINNISKYFKRGSKVFTALSDVSLKIEKGDYVSVSGSSGSGKSTLLNLIGGLIRPDSGEILYKGESIFDQNAKYLNSYRKENIGFIFQQFHLMPYLTVIENIKLSCYQKSHYDSINEYLEKCLLVNIKDKYPSDLSVGEKQRAAFIRAIISDPELLLADEPTGNLDPQNSSILMSLIEDFNKKGGTVVLVSHDPSVVNHSNLNVKIELGRILNGDEVS